MATLILSLKKTTKGTHVYANEEQGISGVYVPKELLASTPPATIGLLLPDLKTAPVDESDRL